MQTLLVGFFHLEAFRVEVDWNICPDGHQKFREADFLNIFFNFLFQCSFQLSGVCDERFHVAEICQQRFRRFFAHARAARNVVGCIARKTKIVDDVFRRAHSVLLADLRRSEEFHALCPVSRTAHSNIGADQLRIVLIGRNHLHRKSDGFCLFCQSADYVVGFKARHFEDRNIICLENFLDDGHGAFDVLRRSISLRFILRVCLVSESAARRVESHGEIVGTGIAQHVLQGIDKAKDSRRIFTLRIDARRADQGIVSAENKRVTVQKVKFFHIKFGFSG